MNGTRELRGTLFGLALLLAACSSPSGPSEQAQVPAPEAKPEAKALLVSMIERASEKNSEKCLTRKRDV